MQKLLGKFHYLLIRNISDVRLFNRLTCRVPLYNAVSISNNLIGVILIFNFFYIHRNNHYLSFLFARCFNKLKRICFACRHRHFTAVIFVYLMSEFIHMRIYRGNGKLSYCLGTCAIFFFRSSGINFIVTFVAVFHRSNKFIRYKVHFYATVCTLGGVYGAFCTR